MTTEAGASTPAAESRAQSFMRSALSILGETGRTDFTVLEVVERSKTSLRAFYQHFATKDELLLALVERIMADATARWRVETESLPATEALRRVIERMSAPAESSTQDSIHRGLTYYNDHLMENRPREFAAVLAPLHTLYADILRRNGFDGSSDPKKVRETIKNEFLKLKTYSGVNAYTMRDTGDADIKTNALVADVERKVWTYPK